MKRSNLITEAGATRLRNELADLWKNKRPEVTRAITAAAAEGDRSENAEYIYRKKQLREMDRRIRYLQKRTAEMQVVEHLPPNQTQVFFGAWVELEDEEGNLFNHRLVGSDEFDYKPEYISIDSPLARALLKKQQDDEVSVKLPGGEKIYYINRITYDEQNS
ncbi:transcription elongation factor GreB [Aliikangiella coralliicola]|uniref:Transcription elongation factor GreB n=1 Tax=Aliikangiella coralliicola TaxID=2592383 RepID=A0A545U7U6_9GAMM|nr:transcription elongation factor GreB [Aliikangiella coralliicola]TQV85550.1 transcription elongation factor GreB [Aliikangiella coralliicola]